MASKHDTRVRKTVNRLWDIPLFVLSLLILLSIFFNYIVIRLPAENEIFAAAMEKLGLGGGEIGFSVYEMLPGFSSVEHVRSLLGISAENAHMLMLSIGIPYVLTVVILILACLGGRWKYPVIAGLSALAVFGMIYMMMVKLPALLSDYLYGLLDEKSIALVEIVLGGSAEHFLRSHVPGFLREGFWCCASLLVIVSLYSIALYIVGGMKKR